MTWTDERVENLKKLWSDGLSASQIAAELGGITRNAVIGKVHRLGLSGRAKSPTSAAPRPRKARANSQMLRVSRPSVRGKHRARPCLRDRSGAGGGARQQHHSARPAPQHPRPHRGDLPVADRGPGQRGILLLRRPDADELAVLRLSFAGRLSAGRRPPPRPPPVPRLSAGADRFRAAATSPTPMLGASVDGPPGPCCFAVPSDLIVGGMNARARLGAEAQAVLPKRSSSA